MTGRLISTGDDKVSTTTFMLPLTSGSSGRPPTLEIRKEARARAVARETNIIKKWCRFSQCRRNEDLCAEKMEQHGDV